MIDAIIGAVVLLASIVAAFFFGKRQKGQEHKIDNHNKYIATKTRIKGAFKPDLSSADVDNSLRGHAKR